MNNDINKLNTIYHHGYSSKLCLSASQMRKFLGIADGESIDNKYKVKVNVEKGKMIIELWGM